jgi:glycosyltransferase involved in cell wall biosynthesis
MYPPYEFQRHDFVKTMDKIQFRTLYMLPEPGIHGGMTAITKMYYEIGLFSNSNIRHFNTSFKSTKKIFRFTESILMKIRYLYVLMHFKPHIVHVMTSSYWGFYDKSFYCLIARVYGIKSILNPVGGGFSDFYEKNKFHKILVNIAINFPNAIIVGSAYWEKYFNEKFKNIRIQNTPNPVNSSVYLRKVGTYKVNDRVKIISVSNIIETKGIRELCYVIKELINLVTNVDFEIIGDGDLKQWLESELALEIAKNRVKILGFVSDDVKIECLQKADIFLMLSYFEIIPISILEAMSASLSVVSTSVGGIPDLIDDSVNGYSVLPKETNEVITRLIEMCSFSSAKLASFGEASFIKIQNNYDVYSVIKEHENLAVSMLKSSYI